MKQKENMKQYVVLLVNMNTSSKTWRKSYPEEDLDTFKKRICNEYPEYKWFMQFSTYDWV